MIYMLKIFGKMFFYLIPLAIMADIVILSGAPIFGAKISAYIKDNMNDLENQWKFKIEKIIRLE